MELVEYEKTKKKCEEVTRFPLVKPFVEGMFEECRRVRANDTRGIGLAAPQVGVYKRVFIIDYKKLRRVCANPTVSFPSEKQDEYVEECLTLLGENYKVKRFPTVNIVFRDEFGALQEEVWKGRVAQIIQHEMDHLDGLCIKDKGEKIENAV